MDVITFLWSIRIFANILSFAYLWYIKEYRFDRMFIHIKAEGIRIVFAPPIRRPPLRPKSIFLVLASILFLIYLHTLLPLYPLLSFFILDVLTFMITGIIVFLLKIPTGLYHEAIILLAARKLRFHQPMKVIGITGSIGKSSTKEFLSTILSTKYNVLKTPGSKNAVIGVAETILRDLRKDHEVFVVEMAAYKKGEIASIARLVCPTIGIVTTVNEQHLDLFGSIENTMNAKYELIEHLEKPAIAIFNADNAYTQQMAERASREGKEVWMYTIQNKKSNIAMRMFTASNIQSSLEDTTFTITENKQKATVKVSLLGEHQVGLVTAAIAGSFASGMTLDDAIAGARKLLPFRKTMQPIQGPKGSLFIDDTFNNNPQAAAAAIQFLTKGKGKKYLVFQPMIELGSFSEQAHKDVGAKAGKICDEIFLTNSSYVTYFKEGAHSAGFKNEIHVFTPKQISDFISQRLKKDDVVLFKGKEANKALLLLEQI